MIALVKKTIPRAAVYVSKTGSSKPPNMTAENVHKLLGRKVLVFYGPWYNDPEQYLNAIKDCQLDAIIVEQSRTDDQATLGYFVDQKTIKEINGFIKQAKKEKLDYSVWDILMLACKAGKPTELSDIVDPTQSH